MNRNCRSYDHAAYVVTHSPQGLKQGTKYSSYKYEASGSFFILIVLLHWYAIVVLDIISLPYSSQSVPKLIPLGP